MPYPGKFAFHVTGVYYEQKCKGLGETFIFLSLSVFFFFLSLDREQSMRATILEIG